MSEWPRPCGLYADHVDHVLPRALQPAGSSLAAAGSTRRWRRLRAYVLERDGYRCQLLVDELGQVVDAPRPATPPAGPDDPAWLRAACQLHNLSRGASAGDARPTSSGCDNARYNRGRWEW